MSADHHVPKELLQQWVHSFEEDTQSEQVYRPVDYQFPPARGRTGFELNADRTCRWLGIAASDGSAVTEGTWELDRVGEYRLRVEVGGTSRELMIVSVEPRRLVVQKPGAASS